MILKATLVLLLAVVASSQTLLYESPTVIVGAGDLNGDSIPDFVPREDGTPLNGLDLTPFPSLPDFGFPGSVKFRGVGDLDGDGTRDLLARRTEVIVPPDPMTGIGQLRITFWGYSLRLQSTLFTFTIGFGSPGWTGQLAFEPFIADLGDVNGDSRDDFALYHSSFTTIGPFGDPANVQGYIRFYSGQGAGLISSEVVPVILGPFGLTAQSVSVELGALGDVDGDGSDDYWIRRSNMGNVAILYHGSTFTPYFTVISQLIQVRGLGDVNGDGLADILYYEPSNSISGVGLVGILRGFDLGVIAILPAPAGAATSQFAHRITPMGDVNGDGRRDFLCNWRDGSTPHVGIFSGANASLIQMVQPIALPFLADAGDVNQDGVGDYVIWNPGAPTAQVYSPRSDHLSAASSTIAPACAGSSAVLAITPPILGAPLTATIQNAPSPAFGVIVASLPVAAPLYVLGGAAMTTPCAIWFDLAQNIVIEIDVLTGPSTGFATTIGRIPTAEGLTLTAQAAFWPLGGGFFTSNAVSLRFGY